MQGYTELYELLLTPVPGTAYDGACVQSKIDAMVGLTCDVRLGNWHYPVCKVFYGDKEEGEPCATESYGDDCRKGLFCVTPGVEEAVCTKLELIAEAAAGESCAEEFVVCGDGLTCEEGSCEQARAHGEPCGDRACADGLVCENEVCVYGAGLGEPCGSFDCGIDLQCGTDRTCQLVPLAACGL